MTRSLSSTYTPLNDATAFVPFVAVVSPGRMPVEITADIVRHFTDKIAVGVEHDLWTAAVSGSEPRFGFLGYCMHAAQVAWILGTRSDVPADRLPRPICGEPRCVRFDHIALRPRRSAACGPKGTASTFEDLVPREIASIAAAQFGHKPPPLRRASVTVVQFVSGGAMVFTGLGNISGKPRAEALEAAKRLLDVDLLDIEEHTEERGR